MASVNGLSGTQMDVDADNRGKVNLPLTAGKEGFAAATSEADSGSVTTSRLTIPVEVGEDFRFRVAVDKPEFLDVFTGTALNTGLWIQPTTLNAATVTVGSGFAVLNTGTTLSGHAAIKSRRHFQVQPGFVLYYQTFADFSQTPVNNTVTDWGFGIIDPTTTAVAPTDGAFFRITNAGALTCVISNSGTETTVTPAGGFAALIGASVVRNFIIGINDNVATFWIDNVLVARIQRPAAASGLTRSFNVSAFARSYNNTAPSLTSVSRFSMISVTCGDADSGKEWATVVAGSGGRSSQGQTGATIGTTAQITNNATPTAATPTNTTAALGSGLGGNFLCNAQAAAVTDFIIQSYQNPAGTVLAPGKTIYVYGVWISCINIGAAVATTPTSIMLSINSGHTAVSLATAEASTTKAPRREILGSMEWPVAATIGQGPAGGSVYRQFKAPIVIHQGEFVAISAKFLSGTATASQVLQFGIGFDAVSD